METKHTLKNAEKQTAKALRISALDIFNSYAGGADIDDVEKTSDILSKLAEGATTENSYKFQKSEARKAIREAVKHQKRVDEVKAQPKLESLTITIEWKKSRVWGWNPYATGEAITKEGCRLVGWAKASGCGYCKRSTVIADLFNQFLRHKLYDQKVISGLCKSKPYGIRLREVGKNWLSYFEGGIGEDCYSDISKVIGGTWKQIANATHVDVYQYKEIQK